ncbi:YheC/YheD family protein [Paenibacillus larvae]|uniref:Endospore coat-associated protein YheD n=5 Tax=Paenibacillus larvae TaxID=1464 RepID=V9W8R7_9BACL|nr:YheC/YheD family protein [Paenibacillus larvae]AHD05507.1 hypothetical protein ERIC2_c16850 [Paenibacillus larvae subsp. larvae DSM 25430]AQR77009.1 hypothetical protein BXP28_06210 [Paenibacillus larvae subsp. larvae]AQT86607.1 hypothetical protein B1222_23065 [Paenibacillus larvae subsp. pulvifaciens]AQZ48293.1 hypothetical protein B5S25_18605 [Paenibacillus larvae subsp. pulvifaciens]ARF66593.1 hypothetical protein B7C51_00435 [Paenibacillus larvae subsp. pulvifaciens]
MNHRKRIASKWEKHKILLDEKLLKKYLPATFKYSKDKLEEMLEQYGMVYIKPEKGYGGKGIIRAEQLNGPIVTYKYHYKKNVHQCETFDELSDAIEGHLKAYSRQFLIQKGIYMLRYKGVPFDLRVMVQLSPSENWEATGVIGRTADPKRAVTNVKSGGKAVPVEKLLAKHMPKEKHSFITFIKKIGVKCAKQLQTKYPNLKEIGVDIAVDTDHHPWILEVNTLPAIYGFKILKDKSIYKTMKLYSKAYNNK